MRPGMRPVYVLKIRLEAGIVPCEGVDREIHVRFRERGVDLQLRVWGLSAGGVKWREEGLKGIVTADAVRDGVGEREILETAGRDLEIACRVTPRPYTLFSGIRKDRRVFEVRSIYFRVRAGIRILLV